MHWNPVFFAFSFCKFLVPLFFIFRISDNSQATQSISSLEAVSVKRKHGIAESWTCLLSNLTDPIITITTTFIIIVTVVNTLEVCLMP
jgi:hypothetical protein